METPMSKPIEFAGESRTLAEWSRLTGIPVPTIRARLGRLGWTLDRALSVRPDPKHRKGGRRKAGGVRPVPPMKPRGDGRAYARWKVAGSSHERSFGPWGSPEAVAAYGRFCAEWAAGAAVQVGESLAVGELCVMFLDWASTEYRKGGKLTSEYATISRAMKALGDLYERTAAADFAPAGFRAVRSALVAQGLSRATLEKYTSRIVRAFRWAAGRSLLPPAVPAALECVEPLKPGRTAAAEPKPRTAADPAHVSAALPFLSPLPTYCARLAAMVRFQQLTGARPNEVCSLRPHDLDRTGRTWCYTVRAEANKSAGRGQARRVWIGPQAQDVLRPFLDAQTDPAGRVFAVARYWYGACVKRACKLAGVPAWTPHQLRHAHATRIALATGSAQSGADAIGDTLAVASKHYIHCDPREEARRKLADEHG